MDMYGVTKVCSETLGNYYRKRYGVDFVALRYPSIYGPGKLARHGVLALYGKIIEDAIAGREVSIPRGGGPAKTTWSTSATSPTPSSWR